MEFDFTSYKGIQINGKDVVKVEDISGNVLWTADGDDTIKIWSFDSISFQGGVDKRLQVVSITYAPVSAWPYKNCLGDYTWDSTSGLYVNDTSNGFKILYDENEHRWEIHNLFDDQVGYCESLNPIGSVYWTTNEAEEGVHYSRQFKGRYEREYSLDFLDDMPKTLTMNGSIWPDIGLEGNYTLLDSPESISLVNQKNYSMLTDYICSGQTLVYVNDSNPQIYMLYAPDGWTGAGTEVTSAWVLVSSNFTLTSYVEDIYDEDGNIKNLPVTSSYFYRYAAGPETTNGTWTGLNTYLGYTMTGHFS